MSTLHTLGGFSLAFCLAFTFVTCFMKPGPGQTPRSAIFEVWLNIAIGFSLNFVANLFLIPLMSPGGTMTHEANFWGGWIYTALSMIRQYTLRRWFNAQLAALALVLAGASLTGCTETQNNAAGWAGVAAPWGALLFVAALGVSFVWYELIKGGQR